MVNEAEISYAIFSSKVLVRHLTKTTKELIDRKLYGKIDGPDMKGSRE